MYTAHVHDLLIKLDFVAVLFCILGAIYFGFRSTAEPASSRRGRLRLWETVLFGITFCLTSIAPIIKMWGSPVESVDGTITLVLVTPAGKGYRSFIDVAPSGSGAVTVEASGRSKFFRKGQRCRIRYEPESSLVVKAEFFSDDGRVSGVFNDTHRLPPYLGFLLGLGAIGAGIVQYRRDPEGRQEKRQRGLPAIGVDEQSILRL